MKKNISLLLSILICMNSFVYSSGKRRKARVANASEVLDYQKVLDGGDHLKISEFLSRNQHIEDSLLERLQARRRSTRKRRSVNYYEELSEGGEESADDCSDEESDDEDEDAASRARGDDDFLGGDDDDEDEEEEEAEEGDDP